MSTLRRGFALALGLIAVVALSLVGFAQPAQAAEAGYTYDSAGFTYDASAEAAIARSVVAAEVVPGQLESDVLPTVQIAGHGYDLSRSQVAPRTTSWLDDAATSKVPSGWGTGRPNKKGVGTRWVDPANPKTNGIRIDQGNPASPLTTQQVDHVVVRSGGEVIGRDGNPISGSIRDNYEMAHIPLDEWLTWSTWNAP